MSEEETSAVGPIPAQPIRVQQCPECGSTRLMRDYLCAEIVCMECGFVIATMNNGPKEPVLAPP